MLEGILYDKNNQFSFTLYTVMGEYAFIDTPVGPSDLLLCS